MILALVAAGLFSGRVPAVGDGSTGVTTTDAFAKQLEDEWTDLGKKKETLKGVARRFEILKEIVRAPSPTAQRFLLGLFKKSSSQGDHRLHAMLALVKMATDPTLDAVLSTLAREHDATLWQAFGESLATARPKPSRRG